LPAYESSIIGGVGSFMARILSKQEVVIGAHRFVAFRSYMWPFPGPRASVLYLLSFSGGRERTNTGQEKQMPRPGKQM
jgi:hypothetical protein